ncbi:hypothetical protein LCGC14_2542360, partial [marine sediment metagenome]
VTIRGYVQDHVFHLDWTDNGVIGGDGFEVSTDELQDAVLMSAWGDVDEPTTPCLENYTKGKFRITYSAYTDDNQRMAVSIEMTWRELLDGFEIG